MLCARLQPTIPPRSLLRRLHFLPLSQATFTITILQVTARAIEPRFKYRLSENCARSSNSHFPTHLMVCTLPALRRKMPWPSRHRVGGSRVDRACCRDWCDDTGSLKVETQIAWWVSYYAPRRARCSGDDMLADALAIKQELIRILRLSVNPGDDPSKASDIVRTRRSWQATA
jgi:hypothetical protein